LSNAGKYSPQGTPIDISAFSENEALVRSKRAERSATSVSVVHMTVRDYGQGIPPEQIPLLFNRFVRLPQDLASSISGNGLGLYLCRVYVESMGGRVWVESQGVPGEGATFHLILPAGEVVHEADLETTQPRLRAIGRPSRA
jgi:signal transduction histidine kinase